MTFTENVWNRFDNFLEELTDEDEVRLRLSLECDMSPEIRVSINGHSVYQDLQADGNNDIELVSELSSQHRQVTIDISMINKTMGVDTLVDDEGRVVRDKYAQLSSLQLNNIDLLKDYDFFYGGSLLYFDEDGNELQITNGFWQNATLRISYSRPLMLWYNQRSNKNQHSGDLDSAEAINQQYTRLLKNIEKLDK